MRSQRLAVATNFLPFQAVRYCAFPLVGNAHRAFRDTLHTQMPSDWATVKHEIEGTFTQCKFLSLQCPSVERTHCILLYVYGRGRRSSSQRPLSSVPRGYAGHPPACLAPPLVKKSRSARLFAYKCAHNASLSLPTFCRFKRLGIVPFRLQGTKTHLRRKFQSVR